MFEVSRDILRWLCLRFRPNGRVSIISPGKEVWLTSEDVFGIPHGPLIVPIYGKSEDRDLRRVWGLKYRGSTYSITVVELERMIK